MQCGLECGRCGASHSGSHCRKRRWDENAEIRAKVREAGEEAKFFVFFFSQNHMTITSVMKKGQIHSFKDSVNIAHSKYSV